MPSVSIRGATIQSTSLVGPHLSIFRGASITAAIYIRHLFVCPPTSAEASGNPHFANLGIDQVAGPLQAARATQAHSCRNGGQAFLLGVPKGLREMAYFSDEIMH
jgi:hypothetical protein